MSHPIRILNLNLIDLDSSSIQHNPQQEEKLSLYAHARVQWLLSHHFPSRIRKSKLLIVVTSPTRGHLQIQIQIQKQPLPSSTLDDNGSDNEAENLGNDETLEKEKNQLEKSIHTALKKISIEDLGNMNATELRSSIPDKDSEGRGMNDLYDLEKKLSVRVIFDDDTKHVVLVGEKKKLEKKVFVIRNMLSHFHWRLSGSDIAFQDSVSSKR